VLIETHTFREDDAFLAWIDSQEVTVYLEIQPREEVRESPTFQSLLDYCPGCGKKISDMEAGAYENEFGQRGHFRCTPEYQPLSDEERRRV
jgi:hypothetical protein